MREIRARNAKKVCLSTAYSANVTHLALVLGVEGGLEQFGVGSAINIDVTEGLAELDHGDRRGIPQPTTRQPVIAGTKSTTQETRNDPTRCDSSGVGRERNGRDSYSIKSGEEAESRRHYRANNRASSDKNDQRHVNKQKITRNM